MDIVTEKNKMKGESLQYSLFWIVRRSLAGKFKSCIKETTKGFSDNNKHSYITSFAKSCLNTFKKEIKIFPLLLSESRDFSLSMVYKSCCKALQKSMQTTKTYLIYRISKIQLPFLSPGANVIKLFLSGIYRILY